MKYNKYGAKKTIINGITFASKAEAKRYENLQWEAAAKIIKNLIIQPVFTIHKGEKYQIKYKADFQYEFEGKTIIEDVKGVITPVFKLKKKLFEDNLGAKEIRKGNKKLITWEV